MSRKVLLIQRQSPGDILTMSAAVRDLKLTFPEYEIDVDSPCPELWENNPHLTKLDRADPSVERYEIAYPEIHQCGWTGEHFTDAFRHDIELKLGVNIIKTSYRPELYISDLEKTWINQVEVEFAWSGPFWLINAGRKQDNELKYYHRWQEVVDGFNSHFRGSVRLVQIGHSSHVHPNLNGVYSLVGKTNLRQLIRLGYWAHGTVGPLSFQFVMSAALNQPHVVVAAGKEDVRWHVYPNGQYLYSNGCLKCAPWGGCWRGGNLGECLDLVYTTPRCFYIISPARIVDSIAMFYEGGLLGLERGK